MSRIRRREGKGIAPIELTESEIAEANLTEKEKIELMLPTVEESAVGTLRPMGEVKLASKSKKAIKAGAVIGNVAFVGFMFGDQILKRGKQAFIFISTHMPQSRVLRFGASVAVALGLTTTPEVIGAIVLITGIIGIESLLGVEMVIFIERAVHKVVRDYKLFLTHELHDNLGNRINTEEDFLRVVSKDIFNTDNMLVIGAIKRIVALVVKRYGQPKWIEKSNLSLAEEYREEYKQSGRFEPEMKQMNMYEEELIKKKGQKHVDDLKESLKAYSDYQKSKK